MKFLLTILVVLCAFGATGQVRSLSSKNTNARRLQIDSVNIKKDSLISVGSHRLDSARNSILRSKEALADNGIRHLGTKQRKTFKFADSLLAPGSKIKPKTITQDNLNSDTLKSSLFSLMQRNDIETKRDTVIYSYDSLKSTLGSPINIYVPDLRKSGYNGFPGVELPKIPVDRATIPNFEIPKFASSRTTQLGTSISAPELGAISKSGQSLVSKATVVPSDVDLSKSLQAGAVELPGDIPIDKLSKLHGYSPETIENEIENVKQAGDISSQLSEADRAKRYFDPQVAREEAVNRAKFEAINHFSGHEEEIKAAIDFLTTAKAKARGTNEVVDAFAKKSSSLKGLSIIERFIPSFTMQIQRSTSLWLDLNPALGFKLCRRVVLNAGWNQRIAYNASQKLWDPAAEAYGFRSSLSYKFNSLLSVKAETETLKVNPSQFPGYNPEVPRRKWVSGFFIGAKKDFNIAKHVSGNVQMLYNLLSTDDLCPYIRKFNVRLGIEIPLVKKQCVKETKTSAVE